jgi:hypothetical protein
MVQLSKQHVTVERLVFFTWFAWQRARIVTVQSLRVPEVNEVITG